MKAAIVGSSGYIAGFLLKRFAEEKEIVQTLKIDQTDSADVRLNLAEPEKFDYSVLDDIDFIVFTAAISGPDQCAKDFDFCWNINVTGTVYFIRKALEKNCRVLFFSSDAVYGDIEGYIYDEESVTAAVTPYGKMKKAVEDEFRGCPGFKAIRLSYVASAKDRFVSYCLSCMKENKTAEIFHPFYRNCTVVRDVTDVVCYLALNWDVYQPVFLNVAGRELVSRVRMADEMNRFLKKKLDYKVVVPEEQFFINRPKITQMKSLYLHKYHIIADESFTVKFRNELEEIIL